jgi:hypothetical protein
MEGVKPHPNIVLFLGINIMLRHLTLCCLVSPWMQDGNVNEYLNHNLFLWRPVLLLRPIIHRKIWNSLKFISITSVAGDGQGSMGFNFRHADHITGSSGKVKKTLC